jgi:hypothetical protein
MAQMNFDATTVAPQQSFSPIPAGVYPAQIVDSDLKPLKSGKGMGLSLTFEVLDGEFKGRKVFGNLNVQHDNAQAQEIAQAQLSALCHATGVIKLQDSSQLHNKPVRMRVKIRTQDGYEPRNEVTGFEALAGAPAAVPCAVIAAQAASARTAPWKRA